MNNIRKSKNLAILLTGGIILSGCGRANVVDVISTEKNLQPKYIVSGDNFDNSVSVDASNVKNVVTSNVNYSVHTDTSTTSTLATTSDFVTQTTSQVESVDTSNSLVVADDSDDIVVDEIIEIATEDVDYNVLSEDDSIDTCTYSKLRYKYESDISSYVLEDGYTLDSLSNELSMTSSLILAMNPNFDELKVGDQIKYPIKREIYMAKKGESISSIYFETGVTEDVIRNLNNIAADDNVLSEDMPLIIHIFKGLETSYETPFGVSNVCFDNKIWADKILSATGYSGASQRVMGLGYSRFNHGINSVTMYCFDGAGNYTSTCIAKNVKDIELVDGNPVAYCRTLDDLISLADLVDLPFDDELYVRWCTYGFEDYCVNVDSDGYHYISYDSTYKTYIKK